MKILIIVHLEPDFEATAGSLQNLVDKVMNYSKNFDRVINITSAEVLTGTEPFPELMKFRSEEWIWGFDADYYVENEPEKWIEGKNYIETTGHPHSEILDWMYELPKYSNYVCVGGSRFECLQDVYEILQHLNYKVKIKESLTY